MSLPASGLCAYLRVFRSGYNSWLGCQPGECSQEGEELGKVIEAEFTKNRKAYGSRRIRDRLRQLSRRYGRRRIARLMLERKPIARKNRRFVATKVADATRRTAPNVLNQEFQADGRDRRSVSDITLVPTDEGHLYLAATMNLWTSRGMVNL